MSFRASPFGAAGDERSFGIPSSSYRSFYGSWFPLTGDSDYQGQPFDFLVDGEFVRMSIEEFLIAKGISAVII